MTAELDNKGCKVFGMMIISQYVVLKVCIKIKYLFKMREWLRGGAPPCQGGGRGFESRLALFYYIIRSLKLQDFRLFLYCLIY